MTLSRAFGGEGPHRPHLAKPGSEVRDVRDDAEAAFTRLEGRVGYPIVDKVTGGTAVSLAAVPVAKGVVGRNLLQGQTKASLTIGTGTAELIFTANRPGEPGNDITVALLTGGAEAIVVSGTDIEITLNTGTSTADSVKTLVDADTDAARLVQVASGGVGVVAIAAAEALAGGVGEGFLVYANGIAQEIEGAVTATAIPLVVADLTGAANGDQVSLSVVSDGVTADPITLGVVT